MMAQLAVLTRFRLSIVVIGVVAVSAGSWLLWRSRFVKDDASVAKIAVLAEYVRDFYQKNRRCPPVEKVAETSLTRTGVELCPGIEEFPCIGYFVSSRIEQECIFRYPTGFDDHFTYLVIQDRWIPPDEWQSELARLGLMRE